VLIFNVTIASSRYTAAREQRTGKARAWRGLQAFPSSLRFLHRLAEFWAVTVFGCATGRCASGTEFRPFCWSLAGPACLLCPRHVSQCGPSHPFGWNSGICSSVVGVRSHACSIRHSAPQCTASTPASSAVSPSWIAWSEIGGLSRCSGEKRRLSPES
jgi:hypothetical protein